MRKQPKNPTPSWSAVISPRLLGQTVKKEADWTVIEGMNSAPPKQGQSIMLENQRHLMVSFKPWLTSHSSPSSFSLWRSGAADLTDTQHRGTLTHHKKGGGKLQDVGEMWEQTTMQGVCADGVRDIWKQTKLVVVFCCSLDDVCMFEKREKQRRR